MCGIVCVIGSPTNPEVSHALLTSLLEKTEVRGADATGFWACPKQGDGVIYTKEPTKSTQFVKENGLWNGIKNTEIDLLISHCRKRTYQNGSESINSNNHPFISPDHRTALVHNGNVPEFERLRSEYTVQSDCDSELLLRMLETGHEYDDKYLRTELAKLKIDESGKMIGDLKAEDPLPEWAPRLMGLKDIFTRVNYGAMAVAIGERGDDGSRSLWLFRDKERPLHLVDMRKSLGQIFVCSMPNIWREAVENCEVARPLVQPSTPIVEFPAMFVWQISLDAQNKFKIHKWKINKTRRHDTTFDRERPAREGVAICHKREPLPIKTNLDLKDDHKVVKMPTEPAESAAEVKKNEITSVGSSSKKEQESKTPQGTGPINSTEISAEAPHDTGPINSAETSLNTPQNSGPTDLTATPAASGQATDSATIQVSGCPTTQTFEQFSESVDQELERIAAAPSQGKKEIRIIDSPSPLHSCCEEGRQILEMHRSRTWLDAIDREDHEDPIILDTDTSPKLAETEESQTPLLDGLKGRVASLKKLKKK